MTCCVGLAQETVTEKSYWARNGSVSSVGEVFLIDDSWGQKVKTDIKTGEWKTYYEKGSLWTIGNYSNGKEEGLWKSYHQNGELFSIGNYSNGEDDGEWKFYHENGNLKGIGYYSYGKVDGEWKYYHENGELDQIGNYSKGEFVGEWKHYYPSGKLYVIQKFENDDTYSERIYHENGNLQYNRQFKNGKETGILKTYNINGELESEVDYDLVNGVNYLLETDGKNYAKAKELLLKSAKRGNEQAEYLLGYMYNFGMGVSINYEFAKEWYKKSCDKNYYNACYNIVIIILNKEESILNEMNTLGTTEAENKRYNELKKMRLDVYKEALPYLEKAYSIDSSNEDVKNTITNIKNALNN